MTKPFIVLVRGLPGSGKTTLASVLCDILPDTHHVENDHYRHHDDGYVYNQGDYDSVRKQSFKAVTNLLDAGYNVVISNVFTTPESMSMYADLPYRNTILRTTGNYGSVHDVTQDAMIEVKERFVDIPGEIILGDLDKITLSDMYSIILNDL